MKAIVFDFDGVLADTYKFSKGITKDVGHEITHEEFKAHHDGNVYEKPVISFTEKSANEFFKKYLKKIEKVKPFFSIKEIEKLSKRSPLYIISSNDEEPIQKFLDHNKMNYFKEILGLKKHKSKVKKFEYLFQTYKLKSEDCIFITDTLGDILEGNKVNVRTIAVDFGFHEKERLEKGNPFKIISSFEELEKELDKL